MRFNEVALQKLVKLSPASDIERAELANMLLEERVSDERLVDYEAYVAAKPPSYWDTWREAHERYVVHYVRGGNGTDPATFQPGASALFAPEANQFVLRLEELNTALIKEGLLDNDRDPAMAAEAAVRINTWIAERKQRKDSAAPKTRGHSLADLGKLTGRNITLTSGDARLETLTEALNTQRRDRRPSFIAFDAEFPGIDADKDWLEYFCQRCGLAHHFAGYPKVLALFRYKVELVVEAYPGKPAFAAPTVLDQPFSSIFFPAPSHSQVGHAVCLEPVLDCSHLAAELVHARVNYTLDHWVRVGMFNATLFDNARTSELRETHLHCVRERSKRPDYGNLLP